VREAIISGERPSGSFSLASAPARSSSAIIGASPLIDASHSGVEPLRLATDGLAPARINASASSRSPLNAAQCSAVAPSPWAALTSAFLAISARTVVASPRAAASATGLLLGATATAGLCADSPAADMTSENVRMSA
jgi:hypothetical protein